MKKFFREALKSQSKQHTDWCEIGELKRQQRDNPCPVRLSVIESRLAEYEKKYRQAWSPSLVLPTILLSRFSFGQMHLMPDPDKHHFVSFYRPDKKMKLRDRERMRVYDKD